MENTNGLDMDFDGVFRFTNPDDEEFVKLWNSKEYTFPPRSRTPLVIMGATPEEVQEIRKKFAYALAEKMFGKSEEYKRLNSLTDFRGGRDDKSLQPYIDACLSPLPAGKATVKDVPLKQMNLKGSKAVGENDNLNMAFAEETKEDKLVKLGKMPDRAI